MSKRTTTNVPVEKVLHEQLKTYNVKTGIPIKRIVEDAIRAHLEKIKG